MHLATQTAGNRLGKVVEGEGFEPSKAVPSDLQSDPFDRSGTPPRGGAEKNANKQSPLAFFELGGGPNEDRTHDLRIANAALSQLSYRPT